MLIINAQELSLGVKFSLGIGERGRTEGDEIREMMIDRFYVKTQVKVCPTIDLPIDSTQLLSIII